MYASATVSHHEMELRPLLADDRDGIHFHMGNFYMWMTLHEARQFNVALSEILLNAHKPTDEDLHGLG